MPIVQSRLVGEGVSFQNAFVTTPLCCPSRSSILTGRMAHSHGVWDNGKGFTKFGAQDQSTIATWLHDAGYRTALIGKYLNNYNLEHATYVPPGWDRWVAFVGQSSTTGFELSIDGVFTKPGGYSTDYLAAQGVSFIQSTPPEQPLFLYLSTFAPHVGAGPAARHKRAFAGLSPWRPPSYNEADLSDKPGFAGSYPLLTEADQANMDKAILKGYRSLLAVDDAVGYAYVFHGSGAEELYDLAADPYQLDNRAADPALAVPLDELRGRVATLCDPPPPKVTVPADW